MVGDEILAFGDEIGANFIYPQKSHKNNMSPSIPKIPMLFLWLGMVGDKLTLWGQLWCYLDVSYFAQQRISSVMSGTT
jgi:hypothetical protein